MSADVCWKRDDEVMHGIVDAAGLGQPGASATFTSCPAAGEPARSQQKLRRPPPLSQ